MSISLNFCSTYISYYILSISENRSYIELKLIVTEFSIHTIQYDYNFNSQHHSPTVTKFYLPQMAHKLDCSLLPSILLDSKQEPHQIQRPFSYIIFVQNPSILVNFQIVGFLSHPQTLII